MGKAQCFLSGFTISHACMKCSKYLIAAIEKIKIKDIHLGLVPNRRTMDGGFYSGSI